MTLLLALALSAVAPTTSVDAPINQVTVFGDRARVTRSAQLPLLRAAQLRFPPLPQTVDLDSIRVEAEGAEVQRVEIADVTPEAFPVGPAKKLLAQLELLDDQVTQVETERRALQTTLDLLRAAAPATSPPPVRAGDRPVMVRLDPGGWTAAQAFVRGQTEALRGRVRSANDRLQALREQRAQVADKARLLGANERPHGVQVTAFLGAARGGSVTLTLSYEVTQAAWKPVYDVQLDLARSQVRLAFAGLVSQTTGEDWTDASLVLSTAVPATSRTFPEIPVWKIGQRERFIPTPRPHPLPTSTPPYAPVLEVRTSDADAVRAELLSRADSTAGAEQRPQQQDDKSEYKKEDMDQFMSARGMAAPPPPPEPAPVVEEAAAPTAASAPAPSAPQAQSMVMDEVAVSGGLARPSGDYARNRRSVSQAAALPLGPPAGYRPPTVAPDAPAALAGGYDLSYPALRRETVPSGPGTRRVALLSRSWPVTVTREVFPALAEAAFLVAELKNPSRAPLPGGRAELFVGDDPAGEAQLPLAAPGEKLTLPLGIDRAIKPVRRVELIQAEKGFLSKDDVRAYKVVIELANPYPRDIALHVVDQWPVTSDPHVKISLDQVDPSAQQEPVKGELDWRFALPASSKRTLTYSFTVTCPRGWLLYQ
jgi:hypothetical protein